jgi:conjugal transfer pilus assembly protein TraI
MQRMPIFAGFKSLFGKRKPKQSTLLAPLVDPRFQHPAYKNIPEDIIRSLGDPAYVRNPPYQEGYYGLVPGEYYMRTFQAKLFGKLKSQSGVSPEEYKAYLEPILLAYAELVHLLPASEHHHHNTPGGLLRHGLEVACFMLDWMVLTKFDYELTPGDASKRLRRWYVAGIIAALFHDAGKPLTDVRITTFEGDKEFYPGPQTIHEWCRDNNISRYFITWVSDRKDKHQRETTRLIGQYVTPEIHKWLLEGGKDIFDALLCATNDEPGPLTAAVKSADHQSVRADRARTGAGNSSPEQTTGVPVHSLCIDAMRNLVSSGAWTFNEPGSRLWNTPDGLYIGWAQGSEDIIAEVAKDGVGGFPRSEISLMSMMIDREIIEKQPDGNGIWHVAPHPLQKNGKGPAIRCVKLKNADAVFSYVMTSITQISATIGRDANAKEFLTPADAKLREDLQAQQKNSSQLDLLDTNNEQPAAPKPKQKKPADLLANLHAAPVSVTLPPEMAEMAKRIKQGDSSPEPEQQTLSGPPAQPDSPIESDESINLDEINDDMLTSMLMDMSGIPKQPEAAVAVQESPAVSTPPASEPTDTAESSDDEPSPADELMERLSRKGLKLNMQDLLEMEPVQVRKSKRFTTASLRDRNKDAEAISNNSGSDEEKAPNEEVRLVFPGIYKSKLTEEEQNMLSSEPVLASKLLKVLSETSELGELRGRVFVPMQEHFTERDVQAMFFAGWVWKSIIDDPQDIISTNRGVEGFMLNIKLSLMYYRITEAPRGSVISAALSEGYNRLLASAKDELIKLSVHEPSFGKNIYSISFYARNKVIKDMGITLDEVDALVLYGLDAVKGWKDKKFYFQLQGGKKK